MQHQRTLEQLVNDEAKRIVEQNVYINQDTLVRTLHEQGLIADEMEAVQFYRPLPLVDLVRHFPDEFNDFGEGDEDASEFIAWLGDLSYVDHDDLYDYSEVFTWYLVSDYLADYLEAQHYPVLRAMGCTWYGRTTYGQLMYADGNMQQLARQHLIARGEYKPQLEGAQ